ncbi:MAG: 3-methyl-2-oxobutanoate hydroxymethyltransferase [Spirochaetes bacterium]|nr:3-methyl-2-oxobutanoate hydroxymethyltransferase [Spirochaetota bacterium]
MVSKVQERKKVTPVYLKDKKSKGEKISMLTAYDYSIAGVLDKSGIDTILVGDSLGNVILGYDTTAPVTMEEMLHHCKAVRRGVKYAFLIADMPFMSYHISIEESKRNAGRFVKESGCDAIKLEGGTNMADTVYSIVNIGIPVVGHIGYTPQTAGALDGVVQGKDVQTAQHLLDSALALEEAGACMIVLECVPELLAKLITESVNIPTIGIGAGVYCDGQVLVVNDMLGLFEKFVPKFVKQYATLYPLIEQAVKTYVKEVSAGEFPKQEHAYKIDETILMKLKKN